MSNNTYRNLLMNHGVIDESDTINRLLLANSFDSHVGLRSDSQYENFSLVQAQRLINLFHNTYPSVLLRPPLLRIKSPKSIKNKNKSLAIEMIAKLACVKADIPEKVSVLEKGKYGKEQPLDFELFYDLLVERINENPSEPNNSSLKTAILNLLQTSINESGMSYSSLGVSEQFKFSYYENLLLDETNGLSKSTRTALARIFYSKIKESKLSESQKQELISELKSKYGKVLRFESIEKLENPENEYDRNKTQYDHRYSSPLERLIDQSEFLRCKDLIGMQLIIDSIPSGYTIAGNDYFNSLVKLRDSISDHESSEYRTLDQQCMTALSRDFADKLREHSSSWLESTNSRIINGSTKHLEKPNGYKSDHIKFELQKNPLYALELHLTSGYVEDISGENGSAAHGNRRGKSRIFPQILKEDSSFEEYPLPQLATCFLCTVDSLPLFMQYDSSSQQFRKYSLMENLDHYYGSSLTKNKLLRKRIEDFLSYIYTHPQFSDLISNSLPQYYRTADKIGLSLSENYNLHFDINSWDDPEV